MTYSITNVRITINASLSSTTLNAYAEFSYAECRYAECCYAKCCYAESCYADFSHDECFMVSVGIKLNMPSVVMPSVRAS